MKKAFSIILAVILAIGLCACGNNKTEKIAEKLQFGAWRSEEPAGDYGTLIYTFTFLENGECQRQFRFTGKDISGTEKGTYSIEEDTIIVTLPGDFTITLGYNMSDGELSLYYDYSHEVLTHIY